MGGTAYSFPGSFLSTSILRTDPSKVDLIRRQMDMLHGWLEAHMVELYLPVLAITNAAKSVPRTPTIPQKYKKIPIFKEKLPSIVV